MSTGDDRLIKFSIFQLAMIIKAFQVGYLCYQSLMYLCEQFLAILREATDDYTRWDLL